MAQSFFRIGQRLTDYANVDVVVAREASGGFGAVAMGPDQSTSGEGQWWALKTLRADLYDSQDASAEKRLRSLFLREALTWRGLWPHPNLLTAQFVTEINGQLMLVLDYAEQGSLRDRFDDMRSQGTWLTISSALLLAQQIAAGLVALHTPAPDLMRHDPVVHRDLKPENVLIDRFGFAMITDFGLAKVVAEALAPSGIVSPDAARIAPVGANATFLGDTPMDATAGQRTQAYHTRQGIALGTPAYMAPEQWVDASTADRPADAYAFGIILAELLSNRHPLLDLRRSYRMEDWRDAHAAGRPIPLRKLGADVFANELASLPNAQAQEQMEAALQQVERLLARLLAKLPDARPTLDVTLQVLQVAARTLGEDPYTAPDTYQRTTEHERIFWHGWSDAYYRFELYTEALPGIQKAYALAPHYPPVLTSYADILAARGNVEEAIATYRQALDALPKDETRGRNIIMNQLGNRLKQMGRYAEADDAYAEQVALMPDDAIGWNNRALNRRTWAAAEAREGRGDAVRAHLEHGLDYAERAARLNPQNPRYGLNCREIREALRQLPATGQK